MDEDVKKRIEVIHERANREIKRILEDTQNEILELIETEDIDDEVVDEPKEGE